MLNKDEIIDFLKLENSHAKKELGQNFLCDKKVIEKIIGLCELEKSDKLLEIGPGLGALTDDLINKCDTYTVVEYDAKFVDFLERSHGKENINIIKNNILKFKDFGFNKVVGNLPYYITSDIIIYIAMNFRNLDKGVFMIQKEAFNRITASKGSKDYNVLNIVLSYIFNIKKEFNVGKSSFFPMPNVESVVLSVTKKENVDYNFALALQKVAKVLFLNRRKTIFNNLNTIIKDKDKTTEVLNGLGHSLNLRGEGLSLEEIIKLTNELLKLEILNL